eukprot:2205075-Amphidinium_carterae.1
MCGARVGLCPLCVFAIWWGKSQPSALSSRPVNTKQALHCMEGFRTSSLPNYRQHPPRRWYTCKRPDVVLGVLESKIWGLFGRQRKEVLAVDCCALVERLPSPCGTLSFTTSGIRPVL